MPARRISKTIKVLNLVDALIDESGVFCSYKELRRRVRGRWQSNLSKTIADLREHGYLEIVEIDNRKAIKLTQKGLLKTITSGWSRQWDGRWRLVGFDIEEKRKKTRDTFRTNLRLLGFKPLQKSLWITPFDVSERIEELIDLLDIRKNVDYFIADAITDKDKLVEAFRLNQ